MRTEESGKAIKMGRPRTLNIQKNRGTWKNKPISEKLFQALMKEVMETADENIEDAVSASDIEYFVNEKNKLKRAQTVQDIEREYGKDWVDEILDDLSGKSPFET